jgi:hypothetical protein
MKKLRAHYKRPVASAPAPDDDFRLVEESRDTPVTGPARKRVAITYEALTSLLVSAESGLDDTLAAAASETLAQGGFDTPVEGPQGGGHEAADPRLKVLAMKTLEVQIHELIDKNADGVRHLALRVRHDTDLLLSIGVADPGVAKADSLARSALELTNAGRGASQQAERFELSTQVRADLVANAMALVSRAEALLAAAKRANIPNIRAAIKRQEQMVEVARSVLANIGPAE